MITLPEKLSTMTPYEPGEDMYDIKLDANESYFSLPEELLDAVIAGIETIDFNRYPDPAVTDVRRLAGREFRIAPGNIVVGNGSDELISLIVNTFAPRGGKVMVLSPDFSMYQFYAEVAELEIVNMLKDGEFALTEQEVIDRAKAEKPDILIFSNPCNPGGQGFDHGETLRICMALEDTLVVVDEAYMDFWDQSILDVSTALENVLVMRTLSKAYGCAALRCGFVIGYKDLIDQLNKTRSPYNVNSMTQMAASIVLEDTSWQKEQCAAIVARKEELEQACTELAQEYSVFSVLPTHTNFVILRTPKCTDIYEELKTRSILVRCFPNYSMLRITTGSEAENRELLEELKDICSSMQ
ncbi:MAG: histidinol-phosphate transaminase [Eubacteriales bacterium]|nr:histidinol-phosphate transaminase [Eubacteriales bacterium]